MFLKQFTTDAIRTEARIDNVVADKLSTTQLIKSFVAVGHLLDMIKKNAFYGKPIDGAKWEAQLKQAVGSLLSVGIVPGQMPAETLNIDPRLFHATIGVATEAIELLDPVNKQILGETAEVDKVNLAEEMSDVMWYAAILYDSIGIDWEDSMTRVINKLKARYPDKFDAGRAINRDLDTERAILETTTVTQGSN